jgi:stage II sporulation protein D
MKLLEVSRCPWWGKTSIIFTVAVLMLVCTTCTPYTRKSAADHLVRVALLCGIDKVRVSGIVKNRHYKDHTVTQDDTFPLYVSSRGSFVEVNGTPYRGTVELQLLDNRIWVINILEMDDYVKGVVPCEIGRVSEDLYEVARAQAVAARTYGYAHLDQHQDLGFDLYSSIQDQVYKGVRCETELTNRAVDATAREILTFKGQPVEAKYHSTCGGHTADFNDAWPGTPPPYLRSVRCPFCTASPHYSWEKKFAKGDFFKHLRTGLLKIGIAVPADVPIKNIKLVRNKKSKRIIKLVVLTGNRDYEIPGYQVRSVLGSPSDPGGLLKSNYLTIESDRSDVIIKGNGWGHGVGMCQFGAIEMARRGMNYKKILYHYYRGTKINKVR